MSNFKAGHSKFSRFVNGKGFYIALAICLVAIGTAAYVAVNSSGGVLRNVKSDSNVSASSFTSASSIPDWDSSAAQTDTTVSGVHSNSNRGSSSSSPASSSKPASSSSKPASSSSKSDNNNVSKMIFVAPVSPLSVVTAYSGDNPVYDQTMADWRVHDAVDLAGAVGTPVKACASGTVAAVRTDDMLGQEIVINHGSGLESIYANLSPQVMVKKGQWVDAGNTIGSIGTTASGEVAIASHLHFAMTKNGVYIDPLAKISGES